MPWRGETSPPCPASRVVDERWQRCTCRLCPRRRWLSAWERGRESRAEGVSLMQRPHDRPCPAGLHRPRMYTGRNGIGVGMRGCGEHAASGREMPERMHGKKPSISCIMSHSHPPTPWRSDREGTTCRVGEGRGSRKGCPGRTPRQGQGREEDKQGEDIARTVAEWVEDCWDRRRQGRAQRRQRVDQRRL